MGTARTIFANSSYLAIAEIISRILQFVIMLVAARVLSKADFGTFNFALSLSFIAVILADVGINQYLIREIARQKELAKRYISNAISVKIALSLVTFLVFYGILTILGASKQTIMVSSIIWLFSILSSFTELFYSVFRAYEKMHNDAFIKITRMTFLSISTLYVLLKGHGIVYFCLSFVATEIVIVLLAGIMARKRFVRFSIEFNGVFIRALIKKSLPFGLAFIFGSIYFYIGTILLAHIKGQEQAAIFSAAYMIALALLFIPTVYINAIYPVLSRFFNAKDGKLKVLYEKSFKYLLAIGVPISVLLFIFADEIITLLYGSKYQESVIVLKIIALYLFIKFVNFLLGIVLSSTDEQKKRMYSQAGTALANVLLNLLLIPTWGFVGAAYATLITEIILFIIYFYYVSQSWYAFNFIGILIKCVLAALPIVLVALYLPLPFPLLLIIAGLGYIALLFLLRIVDKSDKDIVQRIMTSK